MKNLSELEKAYTDEEGKYLKNNPTWHIEDSPWKAAQVMKMLKRNPINPKTIAEIGCGAGEILNQMHQQMSNDVHFTGYDISIDAINLARERTKERLEYKHENLLEVDATFDLMLMMDVFEHVDDYLGFLRASRNKATYNIFHIPLDLSAQTVYRNRLMDARKSVGHLHYFMKETALATLKDTGYEIVDHFYTPGSLELSSKSFKSKMASIPRKLLFNVNEDVAVKLFGGFSLLVLTK
jgi:Methyltransferase domain